MRAVAASSAIACLALLACAPARAGTAGAADPQPWVPDGVVHAFARSGDHEFVGGYFRHWGPATGEAVPFSAGTGKRLPPFPLVEQNGGSGSDAGRVNGHVEDIVSDGAGGWYIAGGFTRVGGVQRNGLAHVRPNGTVDTGFRADVNGTVYSLSLAGGVLYAAGDFTAIGGRGRRLLAALDPATGAATGWNPDVQGDHVASVIARGPYVFAAGSFHHVGGAQRSELAKIDASSGRAAAWSPQANGQVNAMALTGRTVYVGGYFDGVGGQLRETVAAVDAVTGRVTGWNPGGVSGPGCGAQAVHAIAVGKHAVYLGGTFNCMGGAGRANLAAVDRTDGGATTWNPGADDDVYELAVDDESGRVYAGGRFEHLGGAERQHLAAVSQQGALAAWDPRPNDSVTALALRGSTVYAGGSFGAANTVTREGVAELDANGVPTAWAPAVQGAGVETMALSGDGSTLYVGGSIAKVNSQARRHVAAIDASTGAVRSFDAATDANGTVSEMALAGGTLYVAGAFDTIGGKQRNGLAALDATTGAVSSWDPDPDFGAVVDALAVSGSTVFVGGSFTSIGGQPRARLAALSASTGAAASWSPAPDGPVRALRVADGRLYAGGGFGTIAGVPRSALAAFDLPALTLAGWSPQVSHWFNPGHASVWSIDTLGQTVYAAGYFTDVGGLPRESIAGIDRSSGAPTAWTPSFYGYRVSTVATNGAALFAGGDMPDVGFTGGRHMARYTDPVEDAATGAAPSTLALRVDPHPPPGEAVPLVMHGTAAPAVVDLVAFVDPGGKTCAATPQEEYERPGRVLLVNGARLAGDYVQPAAVDAAPGERRLVCAYLARGYRTLAVRSVNVVGTARPHGAGRRTAIRLVAGEGHRAHAERSGWLTLPGLRATCSAAATRPCTLSVRLLRRGAPPHRLLGSRTYPVRAGGLRRVRLELTRRGRRRLHARGTLPARAHVRIRDRSGAHAERALDVTLVAFGG